MRFCIVLQKVNEEPGAFCGLERLRVSTDPYTVRVGFLKRGGAEIAEEDLRSSMTNDR